MLTPLDLETLDSISDEAYVGRLKSLCQDRPIDLITALKTRSYNDIYLWARLSSVIKDCSMSEVSRLLDLGFGQTLVAKISDKSIPFDAKDSMVGLCLGTLKTPLQVLIFIAGESFLAWVSLCT